MSHDLFTLPLATIGIIIYFIGVHLNDRKINTNKEKGVLLTFLGLLMIIISAFTELEIHKRERETIARFELDAKYSRMIEAVKVFDKTHEINGSQAWWIDKTPEQLVHDCEAIASKTDYDPKTLIVLLSDKNSTVKFTPVGQELKP